MTPEALDHVRAAPRDAGPIELIVRRPARDERELLEEATLDVQYGLVGDRWHDSAKPETQITLMNARAIGAIAERELWPLAGDQFFVDFDLSEANLPAGSRLAVGSAILEITAKPHRGCGKFAKRFGGDARDWVNSDDSLRLRGVNARVVQGGVVRRGERVYKL